MRSVPTRKSFTATVHGMTYAEQFEAAKAQRAHQPHSLAKAVKHEAPFHLICKDCGAEGHSTSLSNDVLIWHYPGSLSHALAGLDPANPAECFAKQVGCGKCGSHKHEGLCNPFFVIYS